MTGFETTSSGEGESNKTVVPEYFCRGPTCEAALSSVGSRQEHAGTTICFCFRTACGDRERWVSLCTISSFILLVSFTFPIRRSGTRGAGRRAKCFRIFRQIYLVSVIFLASRLSPEVSLYMYTPLGRPAVLKL